MTESGTPSDPVTPPPASGWQAPAEAAPAAVAGAPGFVYADVPNRVIALIIDAIVLFVVNVIVFGIIYGILGFAVLGFLVATVVGLAISAAYYTYTWTAMRGTIGMKVLGMQIGNAGDGATLKQDQAVKRWLVLAGPQVLSQAAQIAFGPALAGIIGLATLAWYIFLLKTTADSPTKQGWHDVFVNSMVVKAARAAG